MQDNTYDFSSWYNYSVLPFVYESYDPDPPIYAPAPLPLISPAYLTIQPPSPEQDAFPDYYTTAPLSTFPTPSELLTSQKSARKKPVKEKKPETQRKLRQREVAESIGFTPTDPDTISSHEKKRHYLDCVEQYVMYLHEQLALAKYKPVALERVSNYRGLNSRSIRTLLVHMENIIRNRNTRTLQEEQTFLMLRDQVLALDGVGVDLADTDSQLTGNDRRPSIAFTESSNASESSSIDFHSGSSEFNTTLGT